MKKHLLRLSRTAAPAATVTFAETYYAGSPTNRAELSMGFNLEYEGWPLLLREHVR